MYCTGVTVDIKKSTYKNLAKLLKAFEKKVCKSELCCCCQLDAVLHVPKLSFIAHLAPGSVA